MRGIVLAFNPEDDLGVLRAEDGRRYRFASADWREPRPPRKRDEVDFEPDHEAARDIYVLTAGPAATGFGTAATGDLLAWADRARAWLAARPEAVCAIALVLASVLPFYTFLDVSPSLFGIGEAVTRLSSGLDMLRQLAQPAAQATTAVGIGKLLLGLFYLLPALPLLAIWLLYKVWRGHARRRLAMVLGGLATVLPLAVPLSVSFVGAWFVVPDIALSARSAIAGSVFDLGGFGVLRFLGPGALVTIAGGIALIAWALRDLAADQRKRVLARRPAPNGPVARAEGARRRAPGWPPDMPAAKAEPAFRLTPGLTAEAGMTERDAFVPARKGVAPAPLLAPDDSPDATVPAPPAPPSRPVADKAITEARSAPKQKMREASEKPDSPAASPTLDDMAAAFDDLVAAMADPPKPAPSDPARPEPSAPESGTTVPVADDPGTEAVQAEDLPDLPRWDDLPDDPQGQGAPSDTAPGEADTEQTMREIADMVRARALRHAEAPEDKSVAPPARPEAGEPEAPATADPPDPDPDLPEDNETGSVMRLYERLRASRLAQLDEAAKRMRREGDDGS